jgi:nonsense-mediated mRNA decay protein 3
MHCPECKSYFQPPNNWIKLQFESKELLGFCLKKLEKNMKSKNVRLVNAEIVPTESNSKRIKVRVYVQKEILNGVIVEKSYVVEYVQHNHMCGNCTKVVANPDHRISVVQLRQHVSHMRTFLHLEQVIVKHGVANDAVRIKKMSGGIDFFFNKESYAKKFLDFIKGQVPVRVCDSKQLFSHDTKSNDYNYRLYLNS